jgi:hypothetical protein
MMWLILGIILAGNVAYMFLPKRLTLRHAIERIRKAGRL